MDLNHILTKLTHIGYHKILPYLPFISEFLCCNFSGDTFFIKETQFTLIVNLDKLLTARSRVGDIQLKNDGNGLEDLGEVTTNGNRQIPDKMPSTQDQNNTFNKQISLRG